MALIEGIKKTFKSTSKTVKNYALSVTFIVGTGVIGYGVGY